MVVVYPVSYGCRTEGGYGGPVRYRSTILPGLYLCVTVSEGLLTVDEPSEGKRKGVTGVTNLVGFYVDLGYVRLPEY